jgi:predicted transcriptional regulator
MTALARIGAGLTALLLFFSIPGIGHGTPGAEAAPLDARVWTSAGREVRLSQFWGKPTVLIHEGRSATELNRNLKDALWRRAHEPGVDPTAAQVLGVAALSELDWFPARALAERAVRERERKVGIPVLIDWKGALSAAPWGLQRATSSVVVLDGRGQVVFRASGALNDEQIQHVFQLLETLIGQTASR